MKKKLTTWLNEPNYRTPPLTRGQSYKYFTMWVGLGFLLGLTASECVRSMVMATVARQTAKTWEDTTEDETD
jgi:hypothetical protein